MENLLTLTTLRVQNNQLSGTLDVLQGLPLQDLNIENNLFSGPIPDKLLSIPKFLHEGNPFNATMINSTSTAPSLSPSLSPTKPAPTRPFSGVPPPPNERNRGKVADGPSDSEGSSSENSKGKNSSHTKKIILIAFAGVLVFIILVLAILLLLPKCARRREHANRVFKPHQVGADRGSRENALENGTPVLPPPGRSEKGEIEVCKFGYWFLLSIVK
jgi:hypothetical protein